MKPVGMDGSDSVRNGLALSGTLHWMFGRGLISVVVGGATILMSRNKVPGDVVARLLRADGRRTKTAGPRNCLHPGDLTGNGRTSSAPCF